MDKTIRQIRDEKWASEHADTHAVVLDFMNAVVMDDPIGAAHAEAILMDQLVVLPSAIWTPWAQVLCEGCKA